MSEDAQKLANWKHYVLVVCLVVGWASYRLYHDHAEVGEFRAASIVSVCVVAAVAMVIFVFVFRRANRAEPKDKQ